MKKEGVFIETAKPKNEVIEKKNTELETQAPEIWQTIRELIEMGVIKEEKYPGMYIEKVIIPELKKHIDGDDLYKYGAFHTFIFSTHDLEKFDTPDYKICDFINKLHIKLKSAKESGKL